MVHIPVASGAACAPQDIWAIGPRQASRLEELNGGLESCSFNKSFTKRLNSIRIASVVAYPLDLLGLVQAFNMFSLFVVCIPHREAVGNGGCR